VKQGNGIGRERALVLAALGLTSLLAWAYTAYGAWAMAHMDRVEFWMPPPAGVPWRGAHFALTFAMWGVMMVAMMTPTVMPTVLVYAATRRARPRAQARWQLTAFGTGYLCAWTAYSAAATALQWTLHQHAVLTPMMVNVSPWFAAAVLCAAGLYQWSPIKDRCLTLCQSPLGFLMAHWRDGAMGAWHMGLRHGVYCVGCCGMLMLVLFAVGVMDLRWVLALTAIVLIEKLSAHGRTMARILGLAMCAWAALLAARALG
jgi:predicted metal-binding membrane protein